MTTKVRITNESDITHTDNHVIKVVGADGTETIVTPGNFVQVHVWQGTQILITEVEGKGQRG